MFGSFGAQKCLTHLGKIMNGEKESTPSSLKPFLNKKKLELFHAEQRESIGS
jgi:hypothetical protein